MGLSAKTIIFSAPPAWGKSTRSEELCKEFGCTHVIDEWSPRAAVRPGALHLTNAKPQMLLNLPGVEIVSRGW